MLEQEESVIKRSACRAACTALIGCAWLMAGFDAQAQAQSTVSDSATLREILAVKDLSSLAISPDGKLVAARLSGDDLDRNRKIEEWYVVSLGSRPIVRRISDAGEPDLHQNGPAVGPISTSAPIWSSDSRFIFYRAIVDAQVQIWRVAMDGSAAQRLTQDEADVEDFVIDRASGALLYSVGATRTQIEAAEREEYEHGALFGPRVIPGEPIVRNHPVNGRLLTYRRAYGQDSVSGYTTLASEVPHQIKALDLSSGRTSAATEVQEQLFRTLAEERIVRTWQVDRLSRSDVGSASIDADAARRETIVLARAGSSGKPVHCVDDACRSEAFGLTLVGWTKAGDLVFQRRDFRGTAIHMWDTQKGSVRRVVFTSGDLGEGVAGGACSLTATEAICVASAANLAPQLQAISLATGKSRLLFNPNPGLSPQRLGRTERVIFMDELKDQAFGFLVLPRHRDPSIRLPLVITNYVCEGFIRPQDDVSEHALAVHGIAAFCLNDNFQTRRGDPQATGDPEKLLRSSVALNKALVALLASRGLIDPARVALAGMSGGATAVAYTLSHSDGFVAGIISTAQYSDIIEHYMNGAMPWLHATDASGRPVYNEAYFAPISAALSAQRMPPLLMQVANSEYLSNTQLLTAMLTYKRPVEMIVYPDEFHVKMQPLHRLSAYERSTDWLRFWLQGFEDPARQKVAQYQRWREYRQPLQGKGEGRR